MSENPENSSFKLRRVGGEQSRRILNVPGVVLLLSLLTIAAFFLLFAAPERLARTAGILAAVSPMRFLSGPEANGGWAITGLPLVSHMFVHANLPHLLFNLLWLLALGAPIGRRLGADGALQSISAFYSAVMFTLFYFLCGAAGALTYIAFHMDENTLLVGASGGVSGLLGGVVRFAFNRSTIFGPEGATISPLFSAPVLTWTMLVVIMNVSVGFMGGALTGGAAIAWDAHLGGYFFGLLTYPLFERLTPGRR